MVIRINEWSIVNFLSPSRRRFLIDFIRLKKFYHRSFTKDYRAVTIAAVLGCGKARALTTIKFLDKHGFISYDKDGAMRFSSLQLTEKGKRDTRSVRLRIPELPTATRSIDSELILPYRKPTKTQLKRIDRENDLIYGSLCAYMIKNNLESQHYLIQLKRDHQQSENPTDNSRTKMFSSDKAARAAYKRNVTGRGISEEVFSQLRLSDRTAAHILNTSVSYYRRVVVPLISKGNGLRTRVELRVVKRSDKVGFDYTPNSTFHSRKRLLTSYREYSFDRKEMKRLAKVEKNRLQTSVHSQVPDRKPFRKGKGTVRKSPEHFGDSNRMNRERTTLYSIALERDSCKGSPF